MFFRLRRPAPAPELPPEELAVRDYLENGRRPWSHGYHEYTTRLIARTIADADLLATFRAGLPLPSGYGFRVDERVIEYPWVLAQLGTCGQNLFDAGSTLNQPHLLNHPALAGRNVVLFARSPEGVHPRANVSYLYGDLRDVVLRDGCMDVVACISTLAQSNEHGVLAELRRLLKPGGVLLLNVPFGKRESHAWTQFDRAGLEEVLKVFGGRLAEWRCYRYLPGGWRVATVEECAGCEYFNIHATPDFGPDYAAGARAVACLRVVRE